MSYHLYESRTPIHLIAPSTSDGDTFRNEFKFCEKRDKWVGNPATCAEVKDLLTSLKNKTAADGGERRHSAAMKYTYLAQMMRWSELVCPFDPNSMHIPNLTIDTRAFQTEHIRFRAFASVAWTLWTRFIKFSLL